MIFVTLGTQDKSFKRLLKRIDECIENKTIKERVIVQSGYTKYKSNNMDIIDFMDNDTFNKTIKECSILITHGGAGSILTGMKKNKKVIAIPRLAKYKEHTNDHQIQIVEELTKDGYILSCMNLNKLEEVIEKSNDFKPKKYQQNNKKIIDIIENYIEESNNKSHPIIVFITLLIVILLVIYFIFCK